MTNLKIKELLKNWNIEGNLTWINNNSWDVSDSYIIKCYNKQEELERSIVLLGALKEHGMPVAEIVPLKEGENYLEREGVYYLLTRKLPGSSIVNLREEPEQIYGRMGKVIGKLHIALRELEAFLDFWDNSLLFEMKGWIPETLRKADWKYIGSEAYEETVNNLGAIYEELPRQLIHRDVHFGNFLFEQGEFTGYIDFDLSQKNIRIFDIAYFLLGLLCDENHYGADREKWFDLVAWVIRGYEESIPLEEVEKTYLNTVMESIELLFTAYFLSVKEDRLAEDSVQLFYFIKRNANKIREKALDSDIM
ncbi:phosphotransferase [Anaerocolumna sp. AGMB13020]|uniref:phosphotransferase enzyme family protein n=1 Tax=Anaerocolumna sp. AGMB13020 TaxID=3081750 RepID=UPI0029556D6E|nr:phosphotransferase [Anaerocolumna sp. AGMB13020]WOO36750.1 phosphotransferase [Anaerocolumna sp. AGMB13020]